MHVKVVVLPNFVFFAAGFEGKIEKKFNKKSELMFMRRARAYGSSCSQVILVYLHPFRRNLLFCSQKSPENHTKSIFLGFKVIQGHQC